MDVALASTTAVSATYGGAQNIETFSIDEQHFVFMSVHDWHEVNSEIWKWDGATFIKFMDIPLRGAHGTISFSFNQRHFLFIACWRVGYSANDYILNSEIWEWDGATFQKFMDVPTTGALQPEAFSIGEQHFLAWTSYHSPGGPSSEIWKWDGAIFVKFMV